MTRGGQMLEDAIAAAMAATNAAYQGAVDAAGWDAAVEAWDAVIPHLSELEGDARALSLDFAARTRLSRAWAGGPEDDLDAAVELWRRGVEGMTPDFADRAAILNNLGVALRDLSRRPGREALVDDALAASEAAAGASDVETRVGVTVRLQLGKSLRVRFGDRHRPDDLDAAITALTEVVRAEALLNGAERAECHETLGNAFHDRYQLGGARADEEAAIVHLRRALELIPHDDVDVSTYSSNLASALLDRFELDGKRADLDEAVHMLEAALEASGGEAGAPDDLLSNLGNALRLRAIATGNVDDIDRAVGLLAKAAEGEARERRRAGRLSNLGGGLLEHYDLTGQIADVDSAIAILDESISLTAPDDPDRGARLSNLGIALRNRQLRRRGGRDDLDRAVAAFEEAIRATQAQAPDASALHANLGNVLHQLHDVTGDAAELDRAVRELETALSLTPEGSADRPGYLNNLAATLAARAARAPGAHGDLERAVDLAREAVRLCPPGSAQRTTYLVNLGNALSERFSRSADHGDLVGARDAYRSAARTGIAAAPAEAFAAAYNWSEWARDRRAWAEVAEAHEHGEAAIRALFRAQLMRTDKESWLRDAEGLAADGAYALAARSDARGAVLGLERGRALLLTEALEREEADLNRLKASHEPLVERFRASAARVRQLERARPR